MANAWIQHVKEYAQKNGMKYPVAVGDPGCKAAYKKGNNTTQKKNKIRGGNPPCKEFEEDTDEYNDCIKEKEAEEAKIKSEQEKEANEKAKQEEEEKPPDSENSEINSMYANEGPPTETSNNKTEQLIQAGGKRRSRKANGSKRRNKKSQKRRRRK